MPGGVYSMRIGRITVVTVALMAVSTAAAAFQEQQGAAPAAAGAQVQAPVDAAAKPNIGFSSTDAAKGAGTEVRIPGLGKLGVLPKMDFGLELLYGAASEPKPEDVRPNSTSEDGDLRIRGTVKHRF
ncbi:MAG: hypothetical protein KDJ47_13780 [Hyphomicrobiaceae bacterium]|nr:hypothetical protein [Hyphomicrobiaceae bacterium]